MTTPTTTTTTTRSAEQQPDASLNRDSTATIQKNAPIPMLSSNEFADIVLAIVHDPSNQDPIKSLIDRIQSDFEKTSHTFQSTLQKNGGDAKVPSGADGWEDDLDDLDDLDMELEDDGASAALKGTKVMVSNEALQHAVKALDRRMEDIKLQVESKISSKFEEYLDQVNEVATLQDKVHEFFVKVAEFSNQIQHPVTGELATLLAKKAEIEEAERQRRRDERIAMIQKLLDEFHGTIGEFQQSMGRGDLVAAVAVAKSLESKLLQMPEDTYDVFSHEELQKSHSDVITMVKDRVEAGFTGCVEIQSVNSNNVTISVAPAVQIPGVPSPSPIPFTSILYCMHELGMEQDLMGPFSRSLLKVVLRPVSKEDGWRVNFESEMGRVPERRVLKMSLEEGGEETGNSSLEKVFSKLLQIFNHLSTAFYQSTSPDTTINQSKFFAYIGQTCWHGLAISLIDDHLSKHVPENAKEILQFKEALADQCFAFENRLMEIGVLIGKSSTGSAAVAATVVRPSLRVNVSIPTTNESHSVSVSASMVTAGESSAGEG
ncbi:Centromere/kinetochore protein zw10, partial [Blyttiomyces sp. JEL0837]